MSKVHQWIGQELAATEAALKRQLGETDLHRRRAVAKQRLQTEKQKAARIVAEASRSLPPKPEIGKNSSGNDSSGCGLAVLIWVIGMIPLLSWLKSLPPPNHGSGLSPILIVWFLASWPLSYYGIPLLRQMSWDIERNNIMGTAQTLADEVARKAQSVYDAEIKAIESSIGA